MLEHNPDELVKQANIKEGDTVKFIGHPVWLKGLEGKVVRMGSMQPEVITVVFTNGKSIVTDIFQVEKVG